jgi:phosphoesterase RecJ-like protein
VSASRRSGAARPAKVSAAETPAWPGASFSAGAIREFWTRVREVDSIAVICHINPDGDAIGSLLTMYHTLALLGKSATMICHDPVPEYLAFLPESAAILSPTSAAERFDLVILVDCSHPSRIGGSLRQVMAAGSLIVIDHHADVETLNGLHLRDITASSTGELIFRLAEREGVKLPPPATLACYVAILTDTGSFRYGNTSPECLRIASELMKAGAIDPHEIGQHIFARETLARLRLKGFVLDAVRLEDGVISSEVTQESLLRSGSDMEDAEGIVSDLALCHDADVAFLLMELPDGVIRVQLRSIRHVDVLEIAQTLGGGGHARAAGGRLTGLTMQEAHRKVFEAVRSKSRASTPTA